LVWCQTISATSIQLFGSFSLKVTKNGISCINLIGGVWWRL